jgi:hypothetical protein
VADKKRIKVRDKRGSQAKPRSSGGRVVGDLLRAARDELIPLEDPLDAELWVSGLVSAWRSTDEKDPAAMDALGRKLVRAAERKPSGESLALLIGLRRFAPAEVAREADRVAGRMQDAGMAGPAWGEAFGNAGLVESWQAVDDYGDQESLILVFQHEGRASHTFSVLLDHNFGGMARDVLIAPSDTLLQAYQKETGLTVAPIDGGHAATKLALGLELEATYEDGPSTPELRSARALLLNRLEGLPEPADIAPTEISAQERDGLVNDFIASDEGRDIEPVVAKDVVPALIDFKYEHSDGDPLRWSPIAVELVMADWLPRKIILESPASKAPDVIRSWVRYAGRRKGLGDDLVDETASAVERWEKNLIDAMDDPTKFGPGKAITKAMLDEGVDITDGDSVQRWLDEFNTLPPGARRSILR